jgi:hypothetical protein
MNWLADLFWTLAFYALMGGGTVCILLLASEGK